MPYYKYRPLRQFGMQNTKFMKLWANRKNTELAPPFIMPEALAQSGIRVYDPNDPNFPQPNRTRQALLARWKRTPSLYDDPLYQPKPARIFPGADPLSLGIPHALALSKAVLRRGLHEKLATDAVEKLGDQQSVEKQVEEAIMRSQEWYPQIEKHPDIIDPVKWWWGHVRTYGITDEKKSSMLNEELLRLSTKLLGSGKLLPLRDPPKTSVLTQRHDEAVLLTSQPQIALMGKQKLRPLATPEDVEATVSEELVSIFPASATVDLAQPSHIYSPDTVRFLKESKHKLQPHVVLFVHNDDYKYPWSAADISAQLVMRLFSVALAEASATGKLPFVLHGAQICRSKLDFASVQINTLDLNTDSGVKNMIWVDDNNVLFDAPDFWQTMQSVETLNTSVFYKFLGLVNQSSR